MAVDETIERLYLSINNIKPKRQVTYSGENE